tara:strand:+ start:151 stop:264 length:114 start_codon:yes stop_codon:yes gene_type:complete
MMLEAQSCPVAVAPRVDEIVVALAVADSGRSLARTKK